MKQYANGFVANRVLKLNVGFLLADGPGHSHETAFDVPAIRVSDDVDLAYIRGPLVLSRIKEGILVQGTLNIGINSDCYRCLDSTQQDQVLEIQEVYQYPTRIDAEYSISEDAMLDLAPLVRAEAIIADARGGLCRPDCKGLCPNCGANWNNTTCDCDAQEIDPRLEKLKQLLKT